MNHLSDNALKILEARYLLKDSEGNVVESPEGLLRRVAKAVSSAEKAYGGDNKSWDKKFYSLMSELRFLPNSPALMNAGKPNGQLAACFVLPVEDSMDSIFKTLAHSALILKSGGGTGFSFSRLRPSSDKVSTTGGIASGPISFMKVYDKATDVIKQGGARRGANMGVLRIDHPDILDFINAKMETNDLQNFNISVAITDAFMRAYKLDSSYSLKNPRTGKSIMGSSLSARDVFNKIVKSAWASGEPGILFIDRINRANPTPKVGKIESTNPCGEQPLLPYEACVLGSLNLLKYIKTGKIDYKTLQQDIHTAVRFLDNCIDINTYPIKEIEYMHKANRKVGLGVMGWADTLATLEIPYASEQALSMAKKVMKFIQSTSHAASAELAEQRGAFPNFKGSIYDKKNLPRLRNATLTTIAPTGTLSLIADCSSGIEPFFALANTRRAIDTEIVEMNRHFFSVIKNEDYYCNSLKKHVLSTGSIKEYKGIPQQFKNVYKTAHEIEPQWHIRMQSAFQKYTDNAVSKTINLPKSATPAKVRNAYLLAYKQGCKGITIFRYGSKKQGTLILMKDKKNQHGGSNDTGS